MAIHKEKAKKKAEAAEQRKKAEFTGSSPEQNSLTAIPATPVPTVGVNFANICLFFCYR